MRKVINSLIVATTIVGLILLIAEAYEIYFVKGVEYTKEEFYQKFPK